MTAPNAVGEIMLIIKTPLEEKMLEAVDEIIKEVDDEGAKNLLLTIYGDELMHHPFLQNLLELVIKRDLISEEDVYNLIFRDLPTHGHAPDPYAEDPYGPYRP